MKSKTGILGRIALATAVACMVMSSAHARTVKQKKQAAKAQFEVAERLRDSLLGTPDSQRERRDYQKVMDAYRKVYYTAPSWAKADEAVLAVAELLDDQGRVLNDSKSYKDAIGQLAFLRREYPGSRHRVEALFTIAQIYRDDLNDQDEAIATFQDFLKHYPNSTLAPKAKQAMVELGNNEASDPFRPKSKSARSKRAPHRQGTERESKAAWADVRPATTVAEKPAEKIKPSEQAKAKTRSEEKEPAEAKNRKPAREDTPAPDEATADASQSPVPVPVEDVSATAARPNTQAPAGSHMPRLTSIRHWSTPDYVRVAIDLEQEVKYQAGRVAHPDRIFFDLYGVKLAPDLVGKTFDVEAGFLHRIRVAQNRAGMARVVLDVDDVAEYSAFLLPNPYRLIIDIHGKLLPAQVAKNGKGKKSSTQDVVAEINPPVPSDVAANDGQQLQAKKEQVRAQNSRQEKSDSADSQSHAQNDDVTIRNVKPAAASGDSAAALQKAGEARSGPMKGRSSSASTEVAKAEAPKMVVDDSTMDADTGDTSKATTTKVTSGPTYQAIAPEESSRNKKSSGAKSTRNGKKDVATTTHVASPTANGDRSLIRALGLKIGKIVVDAGHGGHDTGTIGPNGLQEKDLVLDVALKLGKLLENKLGAEVVYTRDDDSFIPLETRTAIANKEQADLFISIHANSSSDQSARGVETYYLNFTSSPDALEVAARENAVSEQSIHELQDLVKKIALKEKIEESREFAADVQKSLYNGLNARNPGERNRGVKKAPFVVLIGANMPSILAEISFVSNPRDEKKLKTNLYRQQIAESLYKGVAKYINGLSGVRVAAGLERQDASAGAAGALK
ncbi:MAG TPA: N-acetylmuramoyl-L-alanine amidase [Candidatus Angelobacter sp.]|nr:N-acetylmuramoyl-L-alanine amidase [Candidatus Angelobacter sp.]